MGLPTSTPCGVFSFSCVTASRKSPSTRKVLFHGKSRREAETTYFGFASSLRAHSRIARGAFSSRATAGQAPSMSSYVTRPHSIAPAASISCVK